MSLAIVNNAYGLAVPTQVTLTTTWQSFKITGTLAGGQTGLWIVVRQYDSNGDEWTSGSIYLWGTCLQQGSRGFREYTVGSYKSPLPSNTRKTECGASLLLIRLVVRAAPFALPSRTRLVPLAFHSPLA